MRVSPKIESFDFAEGQACKAGAKANPPAGRAGMPLCTGCQRYFHFSFLVIFHSKFLCVDQEKI